MNARIAFAAASLLALAVTSASAQTAVVTTKEDPSGALAGAGTGAVAGAIVGGPVGAAVGGAIGLAAGAAATPAETEISYVRSNRIDPVTIEGELVVGTQIPETVTLREIPQSKYRYVYVENRPVFVDPTTRQVVYIEQ